MDEDLAESVEVVERVAALDIGKAMLVACVRVPHEVKPGRRRQEVRSFATTTRSLLEMADWFAPPGREQGGDGVDVYLLEAAVLPAGGLV